MNRFILAATLAAMLAAGTHATVHTQTAPPLFFSEYIEGTGNSKALEIYNASGAAVDLAAGGYNVFMSFNGGTSTLTIPLTGNVAAGDVYVVAQASAASAILAEADQTNGSGWFNGDDAVQLRQGTTVLDAIGQVGFDPGTEWGAGLVSTADNTLRRLASVCTGDANGSDPFDPSLQWEGFATDTFGGLGSHAATCGSTTDTAPTVVATYPVNGTTDFPVGDTLTVTFSEPVTAPADAFDLSCAVAGPIAFTLAGGPTSFNLDPATDLPSDDTCSLVIVAEHVTDQDTSDPPDAMVTNVVVGFGTAADPCTLPYTPIYAIQGSGATAVLTGTRTTRGVVVGDYEGPSPALRGFYIQDPAGDGDPATSDGLFVFNGDRDGVNRGDVVRVTGTVSEFQGQTQVSASTIRVCGAGSVTPTTVTLPFGTLEEPERFEGMLVRLPQTLSVTEQFQLGRFGQVVLSSGGRLAQPTSVTSPGAAALAVQTSNDLNRIILDDASQAQNPDPIVFARAGQPLSASNTLRGGDTATGIVGVMTYTWGGNSASPNAYRVRPVNALGGAVSFEASNPRPDSAPDVGGTLRAAGLNLLNYFNTFDGASSSPPYACSNGVGGPPTDCRGADDLFEFNRQWPKTVAAILKTDADVVGVAEMENDGYGPESAIADLVGRLNAATAPDTYAFVNADAQTGQVNVLGTDAIKVGLVYKPAAVVPVGVTAVLNATAFVNGGDGGPRNRPSLAQAFQTPSGGRFVAVVNHLKSKGSSCDAPDAGDGQGHCNAVRTAAADELAAWLATDPTAVGDAGVLLLGDFNAYAQEDPIRRLQSAGFTNLAEQLIGPAAYSYVFDGQWGYLDYGLASPALGPQVTGVAEYHINADEPGVLDYNDDFKNGGQIGSLYAPDEFRMSDHDPIVVGLDLIPSLSGHVTGGGWITANAGDFPGAMEASGKMVFELAARYEAGVTVPTGRVSLTFKPGGFSFLSASTGWLTLSGARAVMQGEGRLNGEAGYTFRLTAVDGLPSGSPDQLRIQIWATATGGFVFDNGAVEHIGRGSIVIHTGGPK